MALPKQCAHQWIRDGLDQRGFTSADLSRAWKVPPGSVTRFLQGQESQNPDLKKSLTLAKLLGITVEELAHGLGVFGQPVEPSIPRGDTTGVALGTMQTDFPRPGAVRLLLHRDITPRAFSLITEAIANEPAVDSPDVSLPSASKPPR